MRRHTVTSLLLTTLLLGACSTAPETPPPAPVPPKPIDVTAMISTPQVEVYNLNRAAPAMGNRQNPYQVERRIVPADSRVTIYSMDSAPVPIPPPVAISARPQAAPTPPPVESVAMPVPPPVAQVAPAMPSAPPRYVPSKMPQLPDFVTPVDTARKGSRTSAGVPETAQPPAAVDVTKPVAKVSETKKPDESKSDSFAPARIYFTGEQVELDEEDKAVISTVAKSLKKKKGAKILVNGHALSSQTDPDARHAQSMELAKQRAFNVAQELIKGGIPAENIQADSWGDMQPALLSPGVDPAAANQRVEILLKK